MNTKVFNTKRSIKNRTSELAKPNQSKLNADGKTYKWSIAIERVQLIRHGIPFQAIETLSIRLDRPLTHIISLIGIAQNKYSKKKNENELMDSRYNELVILIFELLDYGHSVFNKEDEKFQRWLKKNNVELGGKSPESFMDTVTGIEEVKYCLNRIEFGNFA